MPSKNEQESELALELQKERTELEEALALVEEYDIRGQVELDFAKEALAETKTQFTRFEDRRKSATAPLNQALKEINGWFRPVTTALLQMEACWKRKIGDALQRIEEEQAARVRLAAATEDKAELREALAAAEPLDMAGLQLRERWTFEIVDAAAVPREYLCVDEKKIAAVVRSTKSDTQIPGIRVYRDDIIAAVG